MAKFKIKIGNKIHFVNRNNYSDNPKEIISKFKNNLGIKEEIPTVQKSRKLPIIPIILIGLLLIGSFIILKSGFTGLAISNSTETNITEQNNANITQPENNLAELNITNNSETQSENKTEKQNFNTKKTENKFKNSFDKPRKDKPKLPENIHVSASGTDDIDDACSNESIWTLTSEGYNDNSAIMYISKNDYSGCGIKIPSLISETNPKLEFYFKTNFTNSDSHFEIINYGIDNCNVKFNSEKILETVECEAVLEDAGNNWKKLIINMQIKNPSEKIHLYITPPFILNQIGETGVIIFDDLILS